ncbi:uncharacterized protein LOC114271513 [Camellia sinensis]|uniref:Senescence regulator n=2 Tax=Camellia sinensis TaxID=4442 RepID=A0A7J7GTI6_CAMSI|nr:uncharacterized protein LOC114271513 [Camellia sinensis]KAF5944083.1 hypothetical protein HYC85_018160 [Camellia sinensis]THG14928.1 hypothetical protein TEA_015392 [Camellia sinensis var. sinensis]
MEKEIQESEVIFPENVEGDDHDDTNKCGFSGHLNSRVPRNTKPKQRNKKNNSVPVNIPEKVSGNSRFQRVESDFFDDDDDDGGEVVPPHVILGRRIYEGKMAFSLCSGKGRTLKGRDLSQVRNSILRMTGFLET